MKILLFLIFNFTIFTSFAQFGTEGQKVLGGTLTFNSGNANNSLSPETKTSSYNVGGILKIGKFTKKNTLNSFSISYNHGYVKNTMINNVNRNYTNGVFISYGVIKYKQIAKKLFFGIGADGYSGYVNSKNYNSFSTQKGESDGITVGVYFFPILSYQVTNRLVVNLTTSADFLNINYGISTAKVYSPNLPTAKSNTKNFNFQTGFFGSGLSNLTLGFNYLLKNKGK